MDPHKDSHTLAVVDGAGCKPELPAARLDEEALELRLLVDQQRALIAERSRIINGLRRHCHALDRDLAPGPRELSRKCAQVELLRRLDACPVSVRRDCAGAGGSIQALTEKIAALERRPTHRVTPLAPNPLAVPGVGELTAGALVGETAGADRFAGKAAFALHAGAGSDYRWGAGPTSVSVSTAAAAASSTRPSTS